MFEIILILAVLFLILTFFYKQAVCEFRINQMEWNQKDKTEALTLMLPKNPIREILHEKVPLVIRGIPKASFWTHEDVANRSCFSKIPVFQDMSLTEWLKDTMNTTMNTTVKMHVLCPWKHTQAEAIAKESGIAIWAKKYINTVIIHPLLRLWLTPSYHCWAGTVGLRKTFATWTCLFPVDGAISVTIMPESVESSLPVHWRNCIIKDLTAKDTPFLSDLKYMDVILRPGTCLFMPAHWYVSWTPHETSTFIPMTCTISYHTPISSLAFQASPFAA